MNLYVKLLISLAIAAIATALITWFTGNNHAFLPLFIAFCGATVSTALLVSIPGRSAAPAQGGKVKKARPAAKPNKAKSSPQAAAPDGPREHGVVKWFNVSKGFGFITKDDGEEIFVHFRSIRGAGRRGLKDGQRVTFVVADSDKGPQAEDVEGLD
ncbi:MAG: cold shock domain-containing protein [Pseudomonadales bacterium]|nr:cold shock domain-containing protein [Halioglobus sp.]MCP5129560.1 cold shock domain-containing protein [Pseudomonadales bacterium]